MDAGHIPTRECRHQAEACVSGVCSIWGKLFPVSPPQGSIHSQQRRSLPLWLCITGNEKVYFGCRVGKVKLLSRLLNIFLKAGTAGPTQTVLARTDWPILCFFFFLCTWWDDKYLLSFWEPSNGFAVAKSSWGGWPSVQKMSAWLIRDRFGRKASPAVAVLSLWFSLFVQAKFDCWADSFDYKDLDVAH